MPIFHLLYACPACGEEAALQPQSKAEVCRQCGARYTRVEQARIRCEAPGRDPVARSAAEWLDLLATLDLASRMDRRVRALLRVADSQRPYFHAGVYLGHIEQFGRAQPGELWLDPEVIHFAAETGVHSGWAVDELTAVQPSSSSLQLKVRRGPILSFKFPNGSPLLWEERVRRLVQQRYTAAGRGPILEYQPRIVCG